MSTNPPAASVLQVGRYALYGELAAGGMATVHYGRLLGPVGFSRTVAIKRLHAQFAKDPEFATMLIDEARVTARLRHPNIVPTLDVVAEPGELLLVMEYVHGESLAKLVRAARNEGQPVPMRVAAAIAAGMLHGLHAAHDSTNERGEAVDLVHRDVSPQNVLVGADGVTRVLDFGVAKASGRLQTTREGQLKGKAPYMSPEQLLGSEVDRRSDVFSASIVIWEMLTEQRLFRAENDHAVARKVLSAEIDAPSRIRTDVSPELDAIVMMGLERELGRRWATAEQMALAIERAVPPATTSEVGAWVKNLASEVLRERARSMAEVESSPHLATTPDARKSVALVGPDASSVSVSRASDGGPVAARRWPIVLLAVAFFCLAGAILTLRRGDDARPDAEPATTRDGAAPPSASAPAVASSAAIEVAAPAPSASASAAPAVAPTARSPRGGGGPGPQRPVAKDCSPPFTLDARGIHHMKPECL